jgi:hypothetical protein
VISTSPYQLQSVWYVSPDVGTYRWLTLLKGPAQSVWLSPAEDETTFDDSLLPASNGARLAVVVDRPHIASLYPGDNLVAWANAHAYRFHSEWLEGHEIFYYAAYSTTADWTALEIDWPFGARLTGVAAPTQAARGAVLPVQVRWQCQSDLCASANQLFTNVVGPEGEVYAGQQGELQYGHLATTGWAKAETAIDQRGIWIPPEARPGVYQLVLGFANADGFVPAALPAGQAADYVVAAEVRIVP